MGGPDRAIGCTLMHTVMTTKGISRSVLLRSDRFSLFAENVPVPIEGIEVVPTSNRSSSLDSAADLPPLADEETFLRGLVEEYRRDRFHEWLRQDKQVERYAIEWQGGDPRIDYTASIARCNQWSYDRLARTYHDAWKDAVDRNAVTRFARQLTARGRILDAGCGVGIYVKALLDEGFDVVGADFSAAMLKLARQWVPSAKLARMDVLNPSVQEQSFDGIWFKAVLLHIPRQVAPMVLDRLRRLLKPGGILYVSVQRGLGCELRPEGRVFFYYQDDEIRQLFRNSWFEIVESWTGEVRKSATGRDVVKHWMDYIVKPH